MYENSSFHLPSDQGSCILESTGPQKYSTTILYELFKYKQDDFFVQKYSFEPGPKT